MVANYIKFTAATEQDVVSMLDDFLVNHVGWYRVEVVSNTATDRDYTWTSDGEPDQYRNRNARFIRVRATADQLRFYSYGTYTSSSVNTQQVFNSSNTIFDFQSAPLEITVIADKERVLIASQRSTTNRHAPAYLGRVQSLYTSAIDPYPNATRGESNDAQEWDDSTTRSQWYAFTPSGTLRVYKISDFTLMSDAGGPNSRNEQFSVFKQMLYSDTAPTSGDWEIRGYPRGCYQITSRASHGAFVTLASGTHLVYRGSGDTTAWAYGPLTDPRIGDPDRIPPNVPEVDYYYRGFKTDGDTLAHWRFDSNDDSKFLDETGQYHLTINGSPTVSTSPLYKAADFNGSSHYATVKGNTLTANALKDAWTCGLVFMPDSTNNEQVIIEYGGTDDGVAGRNNLMSIATVSGGHVKVSWETGSSGSDVSTTISGGFIVSNRYNYMFVTKSVDSESSTLSIWHASFGNFDLSLKGRVTGLSNSSGGEVGFWSVGADNTPARYFDGKIDEIQIQKKILSYEELANALRRVRL